MTIEDKIKCLEVGVKITEFVLTNYGENIDDPAVLEGMVLAIQMVGGPKLAAQVIRYCSLKVD